MLQKSCNSSHRRKIAETFRVDVFEIKFDMSKHSPFVLGINLTQEQLKIG